MIDWYSYSWFNDVVLDKFLILLNAVVLSFGCVQKTRELNINGTKENNELPANLKHIISQAINLSDLEQHQDNKVYFISSHDTPYTGWVKRINNDNKILLLQEFKNGRLNGYFTYWHNNGRKLIEGRGESGLIDGKCLYWYRNGKKSSERFYRKGKLLSATNWKPNGEKCLKTEIHDGNGVLVNYSDSGRVASSIIFRDGKPKPQLRN